MGLCELPSGTHNDIFLSFAAICSVLAFYFFPSISVRRERGHSRECSSAISLFSKEGDDFPEATWKSFPGSHCPEIGHMATAICWQRIRGYHSLFIPIRIYHLGLRTLSPEHSQGSVNKDPGCQERLLVGSQWGLPWTGTVH